MHCLTVTHGMQEFTSPQSVDVSVKTLKEDSFSSSPLLFSLWPQPLPFFLSIQFHFICTTPKQQSSQGACHSLFCFLFLYHLTCTNFLHTVEGKKNNNYFKELQHLTCDTTSPKRAGTVYEIWIKAEYNALHISWSHILFTNIENISNVKTDKMENLKKHK